MGHVPVCRLICLVCPVCKQWLTIATGDSCKLEGGCTADVQTGIRIAVPCGQLGSMRFWIHRRNSILAAWHTNTNSTPLQSRSLTATHLHIGEGEYGQVYAVKPTKESPELGNSIKIGTTRYGKSTAELCQIVDWEGSEIIFDIKREIYPKVAGYLETRGRLITIDLSRGLCDQYDPLQGHISERELLNCETSRL